MPHQDDRDPVTNLQALKAVFEQAVPDEANSFVRHGNAKIKPGVLAAVAIACWGWTCHGTLDQRMELAWSAVRQVFRVKQSATRQGVMKALSTCGGDLVELITSHLARQLPQLKRRWTKDGKVNLAVDGTKFAAPRTAANQKLFAANSRKTNSKTYNSQANRSKAATVQVLVTVLWHLGTGMPFRWYVNDSTGSERTNVREMLETLPRNVRLVGDAEYVGYPLWSAVVRSRKTFLFRVGSNVTLLKNLGHCRYQEGYVYFWPKKVMRREQPPIVLRLFKLQSRGKAIYLVTNELDMTDEQASALYRERWGIEVFFRTVKQSCQRSKLCCGTPKNVIIEMNWTLIGIWAALYTGNRALSENGHKIELISPVKVMRAFYLTVTVVALGPGHAHCLSETLADAVRQDESKRESGKKSRSYPRKKKTSPAGKPKLVSSNQDQKRRARQVLT